MSRDDLVTETSLGAIVLTGTALAAHAARAAGRVDGARVRRPRRSLDVALLDDGVHVDLHVAARAGSVLPVVGEAVQEAVSAALAATTGRRVTVDVAIEALDA